MKPFTAVAVTLATLALVGCGVHQTEAPPLTGPSELALSISVVAVPDSINQDGGSQSSIKVTAFGPNGKGQANVAIRLDMRVLVTAPAPCTDATPCPVVQDYGTLSARNLVTKADGTTDPVTYTAPPSPAGGAFGTCGSLPGNCVEIVATASSGSAFQTAVSQSVQIRLVPPGVILPPADKDTPVPAFKVTSGAATANTAALFDASTSCGGPLVNSACPASATAIASYAWTFGDGTLATGQTVSHTFTTANTFTVTLTVTNAHGVAASTSQAVTVGQSAAPAADFNFSPKPPTAGQTIVFNADVSTVSVGHTIVQYSWTFGDGTTGSGFLVTHTYALKGIYSVTLSVLDDAGQKNTKAQDVEVFSGNPTADLALIKTGGMSIQADGSGSTATGSSTIVSYTFIWGDGTQDVSATPVMSHTYPALVAPATSATYTVTLRVTDNASPARTGTKSQSITVP